MYQFSVEVVIEKKLIIPTLCFLKLRFSLFISSNFFISLFCFFVFFFLFFRFEARFFKS